MAISIRRRVLGVLVGVGMVLVPGLVKPLPAAAASSAGTLFAIVLGPTPNVSRIDPATGARTQIADLSLPPGQPAPGFSFSMVDDPATHQLFLVRVVLDNSTFPPTQFDQLVTVDTRTGALTVSAPLAHPVTALALDSSTGALFGFTGDCCPNQIVRIDPITGVLTNVANVVGDSFSFMAVDPATHLLYIASESFATSPPTDVMLALNTVSGVVTQSPVLAIGVFALAFDTSSHSLLGITFGLPPVAGNELVRLDPAAGLETRIGTYDFGMFLEPAIAIDSASHTIYVVQDVFDPLLGPIAHIAAVNDQTGAGVLGGSTSANLAGLAFEPPVVTDESIERDVATAYANGAIKNRGVATSLLAKLAAAEAARAQNLCGVASTNYNAFIDEVHEQSGKAIVTGTAHRLVGEARFLIANCP